MLAVLDVAKAQAAYPAGPQGPRVLQPFPAGLSEDICDPFLMCDEIGPKVSDGVGPGIPWHPHRGFEVVTYIKSGRGKHGDSMGNYGFTNSGGMCFMSVGSGIEHTEGGGAEQGQTIHVFQIWVNLPAANKMDDPVFRSVEPERVQTKTIASGVTARPVAGPDVSDFKLKVPVQIIDFEAKPGCEGQHTVPAGMDTVLVYVYAGSGTVSGKAVDVKTILHLQGPGHFTFLASPVGMGFMLFAGKRLNEPIAWHGPFVMNNKQQIRQCFEEYQQGTFLRKRAPFDYKAAEPRQ